MKIEPQRERVKCGVCELVQFRAAWNGCRRCGRELLRGSVESTTVVVVTRTVYEAAVLSPIQHQEPIVPMREVVQRAAVEAVKLLGKTTHAARVLGISHCRVKQLLREAGDNTDYRTDRRRREGRGDDKGLRV